VKAFNSSFLSITKWFSVTVSGVDRGILHFLVEWFRCSNKYIMDLPQMEQIARRLSLDKIVAL